jgi:predicted carbohydrate-binding protein with CBM5 and CBM33 domain
VRPLTYSSAAVKAGVLLVVALARQGLAAPGDLDTSFGEGGTVVTDVASSNSEAAAAVAVQADGKIIGTGQGA